MEWKVDVLTKVGAQSLKREKCSCVCLSSVYEKKNPDGR